MTWPVRLRNPKPDTRFYRCGNRLALFHRAADHVDYWRDYWDPIKARDLVARGRSGNLDEFESLITRYVPKQLPVLEAGCGPGHLVAALLARGYLATGIDYEPEVVRFANATLPEAEIKHGNVLSLEHPSGSIGCYLSVGVVEHFIDGPGGALMEAQRVLHPKGVALISVPYLNPARTRHLRTAPPREEASDDLCFHQYYFGAREFEAELRRAGLVVVEYWPYAVKAFLTREHPVAAAFWGSRLCRDRMKRTLTRQMSGAPRWMRHRYAHMLMAVCRPLA